MSNISNKIIITSNKRDNNKKGINIIARDYRVYNSIKEDNIYNISGYSENMKDKIILSIKRPTITTPTGVLLEKIFNLLTLYNLKNNIKHLYNYKNSENRIIFKKSNKNIDNDLYLIKNDKDDNDFWRVKINDEIQIFTGKIETPIIELNYNFYYGYKNSDYYNFKFRDFIDISNNLLIEGNNDYDITYNNITISNEFLDNSYINYQANNFQNIYYLNTDNNINIINKQTTFDDSSDNILIYNKIGNNTIINIDYKNKSTNEISYNDISINFEIIKTPNIYSKYYGKILLNSRFSYLNTNVLGNNNTNIPNYINNNSKVYLSLGNGITGLTQKKLFNNIKLTLDPEYRTKIKKINFSSNTLYNNEIKDYSFNYLLNDSSYNSDETNINSIIKKLPKDSATGLSNKIQNIDLLNFFTSISGDIDKNIFFTGLKNIEVSNNQINYDFFNNSYILNNVKISNDTIIKSDADFRIVPTFNNYNITYDFRYNYDIQAFSTLLLTFTYKDETNFINDDTLNFYKIILSNKYTTTEAGDFKDVDCIFIYHDPETTTDASYLYPNNNIQVITDVTIDNLSKAIELLPNPETATSNSIFIPARNGSNLSKKRIQGLIGFGKEGIARLLSIQPYDDNFRIGRGFNNQFNLNDGILDPSNLKLTNDQVVALKYNSQKYISQKQTTNIINKRNFADLVRSSARSKNINLNAPSSCSNEPPSIPKEKYYTPFRLFKTNKGNYLSSGK